MYEDSIGLAFMSIGGDEFSQMVSKSNKVKNLIFHYCTIDTTEELNFSKAVCYSIKNLGLQGTGHFEYSNWEGNDNKFKNIAKAIKNSSLRDSLETISVKDCGISVIAAQVILNSYGLSHISANDWYFD